MKQNILSIMSAMNTPEKLIDSLNQSSFDELLILDIPANRIQIKYHIRNKYDIPYTNGRYSDFYQYTVDHFLHPEDKERYRDFMAPDAILKRLEENNYSACSDFIFRAAEKNLGFRWVEQVLVAGTDYGLPEGIIYCYIFDIQNFKDRESGESLVSNNHLNDYDQLTGLLHEQSYLSAAADLLTRISSPWIMIAIDLEKFKLFNEWYGWEAGNRVLAGIGRCLDSYAKGAGGIAGYMGNDDFLLFVPEGQVDPDELYSQIHRLLIKEEVSAGFLPSFGISRAESSDQDTSILVLIDQAYFSCENARENYKNRILYFDYEMLKETEQEYQLLSEFRTALDKGNICFYLQPQCRASNGKIVGAEALVRWVKDDGSLVPPIQFVPALENTGFITEMDKYIWNQVALWIHEQLREGKPVVPVSVNVSQVDLFTMDLPAYFMDLLQRYDIPAWSLKIEITESATAEDSSKVVSVMHELREAGFTVMMDDFGSGYSSLSMLHKIDADIIKIDALFLQFDRNNEEKGIHIIESVVNMAKTMGTPIILEGVETEDQVKFLKTLGCRYMQGFYFYRPMPAAEFEALLANEDMVDSQGFMQKSNEQFRIREFLDENVYSDAMLNSIIGPVAFYSLRGNEIDIVRFNEQFYEAIQVPDLHERLTSIQNYMLPDDADKLLNAMTQAYEDRLNGSTVMVTFFRADHSAGRFLMHLYYLREKDGARIFYGSIRNVTAITQLQNNLEMITSFFSECLIFVSDDRGNIRLQVVAQGIKELGLTREELEEELNSGSFYDRILPEQKRFLQNQAKGVLDGIDFSSYITLYNKGRERISLHIESECVEENINNIICILKVSSL